MLYLAAFALGVVPPAGAAPTPTFAISSPTVQAGQPEIFIISRVSGGSGAYVMFKTKDGTAKAGTDYTAISQLVYVKAGVQTVAVSVPTLVNPAVSGVTLTFSAAIATTNTPVVGTGSIIAPGAPPPQWVLAALTDGGYAQCNNPSGCRSMTAPCPQGLNPAAACAQPDAIAQYKDVRVYRWNGAYGMNNLVLGAFWPQGHDPKVTGLAADWYLGTEGPASDWIGVKPSGS